MRRPFLAAVLTYGVLLCALAVAQAQPGEPIPPTTAPVTVEQITQARAAAEGDAALDPAAREAVAAALDKAAENVRRTAELAALEAEYIRAAEEAPGLLASIRAELAEAADSVRIEVPEGATLERLESLAAEAASQLESARRAAQDLHAEAGRRGERSSAIAHQLAALNQQLEAATQALQAPPPSGEAQALTQARQLQLRSRRQVLTQEIATLRAEAKSYDARVDLFPARQDRAVRRVAQAEKRAAAWQDLVTRRREADAAQAAREAKKLRLEAARQHEVLQEFAARNEVLAAQRTGPKGLSDLIARTTERTADNRKELAALRDHFATIWRRVEAVGLNRATGLLLRRQYDTLPDPELLERQLRATREQMAETESLLVEYQEERLGAGDIDGVVNDLLTRMGGSVDPADLDEVRAIAGNLAVARRDLLDQLIADLRTLFERLAAHDLVTTDLLAATDACVDFIEEQILWVRSIAGDRIPRLGDFARGVGWLLDPHAWREALRGVLALAQLPMLVLLGLLTSLVWLIAPACRRRIGRQAQLVASYRTDKLLYTLYALLLTLLAAAPLPVTLFCIGRLLRQPTEQPEVALGVAAGLELAALLSYPLFVLRLALRRDGLALAHFRWEEAPVRHLRRHLHWFLPVVVPAIVLAIALDRFAEEDVNASLGRLAFSVGLAALALLVHRVARPSSPALVGFLKRNPAGWMNRLRYIWYPLLLGLPLAMIVVAWLGYYYTALQLQQRLDGTLLLALVLVLFNGIFTRWLFVARRRVAIEDARRRRAQAAAEASERPDIEVEGEAGALTIEEQKLDLPAISAQTRQLFSAALGVVVVLGLYLIWADVLPALRMLDRVQIWPQVRVVERLEREIDPVIHAPAAAGMGQDGPAEAALAAPNGVAPAAQEAPSDASGTLTESLTQTLSSAAEALPGEAFVVNTVTLADVGLSLIVLVVTIIAFRNLPGFVEIVILQRLPLDAGARYALSTVLRYAIAIVGIIISFQLVGFTWSKVQWLAAALTFGLAFGLQEIFANFVSGLIILGERPIRVGDTVTIGSVNGTVTRIRMRATTIVDWDRKELIIPNKNFITGDVINWTLSDPVLRAIVPVGVSYGSDVDKVTALLLEIAEQSDIVLKDPKPRALFLGFGDSTLNFELRVFISHIDYFLAVKHEMHMTILKRFREANIEIAFPQRDLHVRSIGDLAMFAQKRSDLSAEERA